MADVPVTQVAQGAAERCTELLILGRDHAGQFYAAASFGETAALVNLVEEFLRYLRDKDQDFYPLTEKD